MTDQQAIFDELVSQRDRAHERALELAVELGAARQQIAALNAEVETLQRLQSNGPNQSGMPVAAPCEAIPAPPPGYAEIRGRLDAGADFLAEGRAE